MKCAIYARVSTKREEQKNSLQNQIALAENFAKEYGFTVVERYIDNGISGSGFKNRLEIQRLLADAKRKKFDVVIAKSVSRLGRNTLNSMQLADQLERIPIRLILPEDSYDTDTSKSRLMFNLKAILAEDENAKLSERIKLGLQASAREGSRRVSVPPFGYTVNPTTKIYEVDEVAAPVVREIFRLYHHRGWGMFKICNFLMRKGVPTPRATTGVANAGTRWQQAWVKGILNNPVYVGKLVFRREETTGTLAESELYKVRRKIEADQQIVIDDAYIVKCSDCGSGMHFKPDRRNGAYICGGYVKHTSAFCSSHIIEQQKLLTAVREDLQSLAKDTVKAETLYGMVEGKAAESQVATTKELKRLEKQLNETNARFDSLLTLRIDGELTPEQFKQQNERIAQQHQDLAIKKAELILALESKQNCDQQLHAFKKEVGRFITLDFDDEQVMKQVLQRLIHKIEVFEGERIKIHYNLSNPYATN